MQEVVIHIASLLAFRQFILAEDIDYGDTL